MDPVTRAGPDIPLTVKPAILESFGDFGIVGIHIEGPHIAQARSGTHKPSFIRPSDAQTMAQLKRLRARKIPTLLTLAPEAATPAQVAEITAMGITVFLKDGRLIGAAATDVVLLQENGPVGLETLI